MKKFFLFVSAMAIFLMISTTSAVFAKDTSNPVASAQTDLSALPITTGSRVPVEIGEGVIKITIPVVIADDWIVIQAYTGREMPAIRGGEISPYMVEVFYPADWGNPSVQHHLITDGKSMGVYTLTFASTINDRSMSFTLDTKHPLTNLEPWEREKLMYGLKKVFGKEATNLTFSPQKGQVMWMRTERGELRKIAGRENDEPLFTVQKVELPDQAERECPFSIKIVDMNWGVADRNQIKNLIGLDQLAPYLEKIKVSPIRVKEGYLRRVPNLQGGEKGWQWEILQDATPIRVIPFLEYFVAVKR